MSTRAADGAGSRRSALAFGVSTATVVALGAGAAFLMGSLDVVVGLALALAASALVVMLIWPEIAVHVALFAVYTNVAVVVARSGPAPGAVAAAAMGLLAIPLVHHLVLRRRPLRTGPVFLLMLLLLGVFALSASRAVDPSTSVARITAYVVEGLALFLLVVNVVRSVPAVRRVVATLLVAGGLLGGLTLYQGVTGAYAMDFGGLAQSAFAFAAEDAGPTGDAAGPSDGVFTRAGGPINEPNRFAQILIVLLPLAYFQVRFGASGPSRALGLATGFLILGGLLLTYSRGAFLTLAVLGALATLLGYVRPSRVVLAVIALLVAAPVVAPGLYDRVGSISGALDVLDPASRSGAEAVARGRTTETLAAIQAFLDHPVLGVGPGHYLPHYSVRYQLDPNTGLRYLPEPRRAHNLFAEMAAEAGAVGLLVFVSIPALLLLLLWRRRRELAGEHPHLAHLATGLGLSILGYLGTGVFLHLAFERYYWLLLALCMAAVEALAEEAGESSVAVNRSGVPSTLPDPAADPRQAYVPSWGARG